MGDNSRAEMLCCHLLLPVHSAFLKRCWLGERLAGSLLWQGQSKERSEVLEGITAFQHLSLEHRAFLTWINSDENRRSVQKGDKHVYLRLTFRLLVEMCHLLQAIWQARKWLQIQNWTPREVMSRCIIAGGFVCASRIP